MKTQRGNALFLILIAVALFAALSYAVTQSGRGGSSAKKEQVNIAAAQTAEYGAGLKVVVMRMVLSGTPRDTITFDTGTTHSVFDPSGGGASGPPPIQDGVAGDWVYKDLSAGQGVFVEGIGSNADIAGREIVASLGYTGSIVAEVGRTGSNYTGVPISTCQQINKNLGIALDFGSYDDGIVGAGVDDARPAANAAAGAYTPGTNVFNAYPGQAFACFLDGGNAAMIYYHTLLEQ